MHGLTIRRLAIVAGFVFSQGDVLAQQNAAISPAIDGFSQTVGHPRIILMLRKDVGQEASNPVDPVELRTLSLKVGIDLAWEANTRTGGQVLSLPFSVTVEQARQAAKVLSLEPEVLWADVEARETPLISKSASIKTGNQDGTDEITSFIVKVRGDNLSTDINPGLLSKFSNAAGVKFSSTRRTAFARVLTVEAPVSLQQAEAIESALERLPEVLYADPDRLVRAETVGSVTPNDPLFWRNWHLQGPLFEFAGPDPYFVNGYPGAANVQAAWALTKGSASTGVAVVDSGILFDHPDLKRSLGRQKAKRGWDMITSIAKARDGNARDPDAQDEGNWLDASTGCGDSKQDSSWHGSHVAGIIAATTNNGDGVSGINWKAKIVPVRVLGPCGGTLVDITDGIIWAAGDKEVPGADRNRTPVKVINLSVGGYGLTCPDLYQEAIDYALSKGISFVASAGNNFKDVELAYPANCRGVISVAAVNHLGDLAWYSNHGSSITIAAPGGQKDWSYLEIDPVNGKGDGKITTFKDWGVWSTVNSGKTVPEKEGMTYAPMEGTSMAAPVVSGVVSLMYAADKKHKLTPELVKNILRSTANEFPKSNPGLRAYPGLNPFEWVNNPVLTTRCTQLLVGKCGAGIVDAEAAVRAVLDLK